MKTNDFYFRKISEVDKSTMTKYRQATIDSYPRFVVDSKIVEEFLPKLDERFPEYQILAFNKIGKLIGFLNTLPIYWDNPLKNLPDTGWDWLIQKGFSDYNDNVPVNTLGAVQIIVIKEFLGQGYSKIILNRAKQLMDDFKLNRFILPIRPTLKHTFPELTMAEYLNKRVDGLYYDPWIRVHLRNGAQVIKVCSNSMNVMGSVQYWEKFAGHSITESGKQIIDGALNPIIIDLDQKQGEYQEENIWIYYD